MNINIQSFLDKQTCASICCIDENNKPYSFSCYYVFNADNGLMYFKSSLDSYHVRLIMENPATAITVLPDRLNKLVLKGAQLQGVVLNPDEAMAAAATMFYHKKLPFAVALKGTVFTIRLDRIKMTDSSRIFGNKINWERETGEFVIPLLNKNIIVTKNK